MTVELEELKNNLQNSPKDSKSLKNLGKFYLKSGNYKQAREEYYLASLFSPRLIAKVMLDYEGFISQNFDNVQLRLSIISLLLSWEDIDTAMLELEELIEKFEDNPTAYNLLGNLYIKQERFDNALSLLLKATSLGIKNTQISEMLAGVYLEKGMHKEAISFFEELSKNKNSLRTLAELYARINDFDNSAEKYFEMFQSDTEVSNEAIMKIEELLSKNEKSFRIKEILVDIYCRCLKPDKALSTLLAIINYHPEKKEEVALQLKKILKNYPSHPEASLLLAKLSALKGNYSEAIDEYAKLVKIKPQMIDSAVAGCNEILKKFPEQFLARQFLINAYLDKENYKEALTQSMEILKFYKEGADWVISKCREIIKNDASARIVIGNAYLIKGDVGRALLEAENILSQEKNNLSALILLGEVYLAQGLCRKAVETFGRALEISPSHLEAQVHYKQSRTKELLLEAESIKKRMTEDEWRVSLHLDLGKIYLIINKREEALRELQSSLRDQKRASFAYLLMGNLYREEGRFDMAASVLKKGLENVSPELSDVNKKIRFCLALTYESQGFVKKSLKLLEDIFQEDIDFPYLKEKIKFLKDSSYLSIQNKMLAAISAFSDEPLIIGVWGREPKVGAKKQNLSISFSHSNNIKGFDYFISGMHQSAHEEFSLAAQLDPNSSAGLNNLGVSYLFNNQIDEALNALSHAFDADPASSIIANNLGLTHFKHNNLKEAQKWLEKAISVNKGFSAALVNLADIQIAGSNVKNAVENYKKIHENDILFETAKKRLWGRII